MAVAARRSGFTLWVAWVAASALAALVVESATPGAYIPIKDINAWISAALIALPLALLQFIILRVLLDVSTRLAALWFGLTLLAAVAATVATVAWWQIFPLTMQWSIPLSDQGFDISYSEDYFEPLFFGVAQGIVLAMILRHKSAAVVWVAVNLVAMMLVLKFFSTIISPVPIDYQLAGGRVLAVVVFQASYAAVTGAALLALTVRRRPATAPAPAAR